MKATLEPSEDRTTRQRRSFGGREAGEQAAGDIGRQQGALSRRIASSPAMAAQRKEIEWIYSAADPVQKQSPPEDEELLQGKFISQFQGPEEEDELMG